MRIELPSVDASKYFLGIADFTFLFPIVSFSFLLWMCRFGQSYFSARLMILISINVWD